LDASASHCCAAAGGPLRVFLPTICSVHLLSQTSTSKQDAALFAEMLSLTNDGRHPALDLDPQQRRQKTLQALTAQVEALWRQSPRLMIFEDAHWTDPSSLEPLGRVFDGVRSLPVLLIVTFRPEFEPPWLRQPIDGEGRHVRPSDPGSPVFSPLHRGCPRPLRRAWLIRSGWKGQAGRGEQNPRAVWQAARHRR
jgi:hypothetical protein